jgi:cbb3-type cytochrome oxidase cytochrome c subunit
MNKMLAKLMEKKKPGKLSETYKNAKMSVLENLSNDMSGMLSDDVKGLKKVTVASKDAEGLKEGLDKAEELLSGSEDESEEESEEEGQEMSSDSMGIDELDAKIAELEALKAKKMKV